MKYLILFSLLFSYSISAFSKCRVSSPLSINYSANPRTGKIYAYGESGALSADQKNKIGIAVSGCTEEAGKGHYLLVAQGNVYTGMTTSTQDVSYSGNIADTQCKIENNPYKGALSFDDRKKIYDESNKVARSCNDVLVTHLGSKDLELAKDQPHCQFEKVDKNTIRFFGGFCYLRLFQDSYFFISPKMKKECADKKYLAENNIRSREYWGRLNLFVSSPPRNDGPSEVLQPLKTTPIRYSIEPYNNVFALSDDFGIDYPLWPNNYVFPDVKLGPVELIKNDSGHNEVKLPFLVNHLCSAQCKGTTCSSLCDFAIPLSAEVELSSFDRKGKPVWEASWYEGEVVPPQFQGFLDNQPFDLDREVFEVGKRYRITITFRDPKEDFTFLQKQMDLNGLRLPGLKIGGAGQKIGSEIPSINSVQPTTTLPAISEVREFSMQTLIGNLDGDRQALAQKINFKYWPPFYNKFCLSDTKTCTGVDRSYHYKMVYDFTISGTILDGARYMIDKTQLKTAGPLFQAQTTKNPSVPYLNCETDFNYDD